MPHWTYESESVPPTSDLEQGDILRPTEGLQNIFAEVHPHFCDRKYLAFMIATQSCDLVKRGAESKAAYINLSAVRPLSQVLPKLVAHVGDPASGGVFRTSRKLAAKQLLHRIFHQNEQALGLFFLHQDADVGVNEHAVAFLRVTVALRPDHYDTLRLARQGRLTHEFRAKLGWLIGNLYVRPATRDWSDMPGGKRACSSLVEQWVNDVQWVDDDIVDQAVARGIDIGNATPEELEVLRPPSRLERALIEMDAELRRIDPTVANNVSQRLSARLRANGKFVKLFRAGAEPAAG